MTKNLRKLCALMLSVLLVVGMLPVAALSAAAAGIYDNNGFGTDGDRYEPAEYMTPDSADSAGYYAIGNAGQLYWFAALVNGETDYITYTEADAERGASADAVLTADIDLNPNYSSIDYDDSNSYQGAASWTPIGAYTDNNNSVIYEGTFDGSGYTVSGVIVKDVTRNAGLFGTVSGTVKNLTVTNGYSSCSVIAGGICGYLTEEGIVSNCVNNLTVVSSTEEAGGIVGDNYKGTVTDCVNNGSVTGYLNAGGICGQNNQGTISSCENTGAVTANTNNAGGICGRVLNTGTINGCVNSGDVCANTSHTGGICGRLDAGAITYSTNTGSVMSSGSYVGGICGYIEKNNSNSDYTAASILWCANECDTTGANYLGGVLGYSSEGTTVTIENCYNAGDVYTVSNKGESIGGIAGYIDSGSINNCHSCGVLTVSGFSMLDAYYGGIVGYIGGNVTNCVYLESDSYNGTGSSAGSAGNTENSITAATAEEFSSGELAYTLAGNVGDDEENIWSQTLSGDGADEYPVFDGETVYKLTMTRPAASSIRGNLSANNSSDTDTEEKTTVTYANEDMTVELEELSGAYEGCTWVYNNIGYIDTFTMIAQDTELVAMYAVPQPDEVTVELYYEQGDAVEHDLSMYIVSPENVGGVTFSIDDESSEFAVTENGILTLDAVEEQEYSVDVTVTSAYGKSGTISVSVTCVTPNVKNATLYYAEGDSVEINLDDYVRNAEALNPTYSVDADGFTVEDGILTGTMSDTMEITVTATSSVSTSKDDNDYPSAEFTLRLVSITPVVEEEVVLYYPAGEEISVGLDQYVASAEEIGAVYYIESTLPDTLSLSVDGAIVGTIAETVTITVMVRSEKASDDSGNVAIGEFTIRLVCITPDVSDAELNYAAGADVSVDIKDYVANYDEIAAVATIDSFDFDLNGTVLTGTLNETTSVTVTVVSGYECSVDDVTAAAKLTVKLICITPELDES